MIFGLVGVLHLNIWGDAFSFTKINDFVPMTISDEYD
jgi:hypothetical protein